MTQAETHYDRERFERLLVALKIAGTGFGKIADELGTPYHIVVMNARGDVYSQRIVNAIARHLPPAEAGLLPTPPRKAAPKS